MHSQQAPPTNFNGQQQGQNSNSADLDIRSLSLLTKEAARRTPTLNLPPCATADVPLDPTVGNCFNDCRQNVLKDVFSTRNLIHFKKHFNMTKMM